LGSVATILAHDARGAVGELSPPVFIVPMELASLAGTLGGISQIAASAFGETTVSEAARGTRRPSRSGPDSPGPVVPGAAVQANPTPAGQTPSGG
jgi:hypothetical protein